MDWLQQKVALTDSKLAAACFPPVLVSCYCSLCRYKHYRYFYLNSTGKIVAIALLQRENLSQDHLLICLVSPLTDTLSPIVGPYLTRRREGMPISSPCRM